MIAAIRPPQGLHARPPPADDQLTIPCIEHGDWHGRPIRPSRRSPTTVIGLLECEGPASRCSGSRKRILGIEEPLRSPTLTHGHEILIASDET